MARRRWRQEDQVTSDAANNLYADSIAAYPDEATRTADWFRPVTDLRLPEDAAAPPTEGQNSVIAAGPDEAAFDVWNGQAWVPWRRVSAAETGLIQVVITDTAVEEGVTGDATATFQVYLVNAEATISNYTDPRFRINPADLGHLEISVNFNVAEYDPLTPEQKARQGIAPGDNLFREAAAGVDFDASVAGTLKWTSADDTIVKEVVVPIVANPQEELNERFQMNLSGFVNVKPLKPVGICIITDNILPLLRVEDVTVATSRISDANPNIAARSVPITISVNQAAEADINFTYTTFDDTARAPNDYVAVSGTGVIRAGETTPETAISVRIPTQLLEETERFGFRVTLTDRDTATGILNRAVPLKPEAIITLTGRALKPTYYPEVVAVGPGFGGGKPSRVTMRVNCVPAPDFRSGPIVVRWATDDTAGVTSPGIFATSGYHYRAASGTLTFNSGVSERTLSIDIPWSYVYATAEKDADGNDIAEHLRAEIVDVRVNFTLQSGDGEPATAQGVIQLYGEPDVDPELGANLLSIGTGFQVQEGEIVTIPVRITSPPPIGTVASVDYNTVGRTAIRGVHFEVASGTLTWNPNPSGGAYNHTQHVSIKTLVSGRPPPTRMLDLHFSRAVRCAFTGGANSFNAGITIADVAGSEPLITGQNVSVPDPAVGTRRTIFIPVVLSGDVVNGQAYTFSYAPSQVDALAGINYVRVSRRQISITPTAGGGNRETNLPFTIIGSGITRAVSFLVYIGTAASGGVQTPPGLRRAADFYRVTITPTGQRPGDTAVLPSVEVRNVSVKETDGLIQVPVDLSAAAPAACSLSFRTGDGTGTAGTDYTETSGTLSFNEGSTRAFIEVPVLPNETSTEDKTFNILLSGYTNCLPGATSNIRVTVENTDAVRPEPQPEDPPTINIADGALTVPASGTATGNFVISTSRVLPEDITGTITTSGGTATAGTHYNALTNTTWRLRAGTAFVGVPVTIRSATLTADLTFNARISLTTDNASLGDRDAVFTINRAAVPNDIRVQDLNLSDAATTTANVVITRTGGTGRVTFRVSTLDGTARQGVRYRRVNNLLVTIPAGETAATVPITIIRPTGRVPQATFTLRASALSDDAGTISRRDGTITLPAYEPVVRTTPYITLSNGAQTEPPAGGQAFMDFTITASKVWTANITGTFRTSPITASAGSDFRTTNVTWTIPVGSRTATIRVPILADTANELNETFRATITISSRNARFASGRNTLTSIGTISNRRLGLPTLSVGDVTLADRATGSVNVPVTRSGDTRQRVFYIAETYSTGSATSGTDYEALSNSRRSIAAGTTQGLVPITIPLPTTDQPRETFGLRIHTPQNATLADDRGIITLPAYTAPPPTFTLTRSITARALVEVRTGRPRLNVEVHWRIAVPRSIRGISGQFVAGLNVNGTLEANETGNIIFVIALLGSETAADIPALSAGVERPLVYQRSIDTRHVLYPWYQTLTRNQEYNIEGTSNRTIRSNVFSLMEISSLIASVAIYNLSGDINTDNINSSVTLTR